MIRRVIFLWFLGLVCASGSLPHHALIQTFAPNSFNQISSVSRSGSFTFAGALPEPASGISVNGAPAKQYSDLTFATTNLTLTNGANSFTVVATNLYGLKVTNTTAANLPSTVTFAYDANGNLTNDNLRAFQYDAENQLTNVSIASQWQTVFIYDALNRRRVESNSVWQSGASVVTNTTRFLYDGAVPLAELNSTNGLLVTYTRGLDLSLSLDGAGGIGGLLARTDSNGAAFYHTDLNGNVTTLMDQYQHVVARYEYDPFGKVVGQWGSYATLNRYGFSSKERVLPANLSYYGARFYDPTLQRWLNQDPIGEAGGGNLYNFVGNSPLDVVDPVGNGWFSAAGDAAVRPIADLEVGSAQAQGAAALNQQLGQNGYASVGDFQQANPGWNGNGNLTAGNPQAAAAGANLASGAAQLELDFAQTVAPEAAAARGAEDAAAAAEDAAAAAAKGSKAGEKCEKTKGSYVHQFESGRKYIGKGSPERMERTASNLEKTTGDKVVNSTFTPSSPNTDLQGFIDEAKTIQNSGGVPNPNLYNKINSPGKRYLPQ